MLGFILVALVAFADIILNVVGGGGPIMGDLWALKGLVEEGL